MISNILSFLFHVHIAETEVHEVAESNMHFYPCHQVFFLLYFSVEPGTAGDKVEEVEKDVRDQPVVINTAIEEKPKYDT